MLARFALVLGWLLGPGVLVGQATLDSATAAPVGRLLARFDATASTARTSDAAGRAALFTDDAVVINAFGNRVEGRMAVDAFWVELYRSGTFAGSRIERLERRERMLGPGLVLVDHVECLTGQRGPNSGRELPPRIVHVTLVLRQTGAGEWRIAYYRAGDVRDLPRRQPSSPGDSVARTPAAGDAVATVPRSCLLR